MLLFDRNILFNKVFAIPSSTNNSFDGLIPTWIDADNDQAFVAYAESNLSGLEDVMVIHDHFIPHIFNFCMKMKWKYCERKEVIGSESSVVIIYDHVHFRYESYTRAKHQLFIVTIKSDFVKGMANVLEGIKIGVHDDLPCQEYHEEVLKRFDIVPSPTLCKYKQDKKLIQKLIKKIVIK